MNPELAWGERSKARVRKAVKELERGLQMLNCGDFWGTNVLRVLRYRPQLLTSKHFCVFFLYTYVDRGQRLLIP